MSLEASAAARTNAVSPWRTALRFGVVLEEGSIVGGDEADESADDQA
jgi:hypothetical protein